MINDNKLAFWIEHNVNVLLVGKHGVGKTSMVKDAFEKAGLKWKYFSTATMDPWVDFIGVPRAVKDGDTEFLELVRPREFADDAVEAIFFDEFNRSPKKVRNAVMELIQFKSINGRKFNNLRIIWAAVNPDDEEKYDVERIDEAQLDRFHVHVDVPYKCSLPYFSSKYGKEIAEAAISWWNELPPNQKEKVSPRRLDYALMMDSVSGNIRDVLPDSSNIPKLVTVMQTGPIKKTLQRLLKEGKSDEAKTFLLSENNYSSAVDHIVNNEEYMKFFMPVMSPEKLSSLLSSKSKVFDFIMNNLKNDVFAKIVVDVCTVTKKKSLFNKIKKVCKCAKNLPPELNKFLFNFSLGTTTTTTTTSNPIVRGNTSSRYGTVSSSITDWSKYIATFPLTNTQERMAAYKIIQRDLPKTMKTTKDALDTLEVLGIIIKRTQKYVAGRNLLPHIVLYANHCCDEAFRLLIPTLSHIDAVKKVAGSSVVFRNRLCEFKKEDKFWWTE